MRTIFLLFFFGLMACFKSETDISQRVSVKLTLQIIEQKKYGSLRAVSIAIKNQSDSRIYLADILPLHLEVLKMTPTGSYQNYFDSWMYNEAYLDDMDSIYRSIGVRNGFRRVFDATTRKLIDPVAIDFYKATLEEKKMKASKDTTVVRTWTRKKFESILFLDPHQEYTCVESITGLGKGSYQILFSYSGSAVVNHVTKEYDYLKLTLPENLNSYKKWNGQLSSDTLYLDIK